MTDKEIIREFLVGMANADCCDTQVANAINKIILPFIDSMQKEHATSVWHDKEEKPDIQRRIVAICYMDIPRAGYYNEINPRLIKYWAYIDELLKL